MTQNEITLYFYPSPGLRWTSPAALAATTARNKLLGLPRAIGHVTVRIRSVEGSSIDILTGMTQLHKKEGRKEVLFGGYGLGILLHDFKGALEEAVHLEPELRRRAARGNLSYLRFETTRPAIERVVEFLKGFRERGAHHHYGMPHRPRYGEGSGCSAFAAGILEIAGLLSKEHRQEWTRDFLVPTSHIGGPRTGRYVGFWKTLSRFDWASPDEPHEKGFFWDPDLMHAWTLRRFEEESRALSGKGRPEKWKKACGLVVDAREAQVPTDELFQGKPSELFLSIRHSRPRE